MRTCTVIVGNDSEHYILQMKRNENILFLQLRNMSAEEIVNMKILLDLAISKCGICEAMLNDLHDKLDRFQQEQLAKEINNYSDSCATDEVSSSPEINE